jgi:hypothetical protein
MERKNIYCNECQKMVEARLTNGAEIYPHRTDLSSLPFWVCDNCHNYVGCHNKTDDPTRPLGTIPTEEARKARYMVHRVIDPLWKSGKISRRKLYKILSQHIGKTYHTANITTMAEAFDVLGAVDNLKLK